MDKNRRRALRSEIRAVASALRMVWDPIGGGVDEGLPADEYNSYAPVIVGMLERGDSDRAIAEHLRELETERMGLGARPLATLEAIAGQLRAAARAVDRAS
jgi:hypothetical protein